MPAPRPAARILDEHVCPMCDGPVPHVGGPILPTGSPNVLIGGMPAARVSDRCFCVGAPDVIIEGAPTVLINGLPAARMLDMTAHGGRIVTGCPTVLIGDSASFGASGPPSFCVPCAIAAAKAGTPFYKPSNTAKSRG